jgi:hypothetical protein
VAAQEFLFPIEPLETRARCMMCKESTPSTKLKAVQMLGYNSMLCPACVWKITRKQRKPKLPKYEPGQLSFDFMSQ